MVQGRDRLQGWLAGSAKACFQSPLEWAIDRTRRQSDSGSGRDQWLECRSVEHWMTQGTGPGGGKGNKGKKEREAEGPL